MNITDDMYEYITRIVPNEDDRQDVFVQLLEIPKDKEPTFTNEAMMKSWLYVVAKRQIGMRLKKEKWRDGLEADNVVSLEQWSGVHGKEPSPEDVLDAEERMQEVIDLLSDRERDVFERIILDGESYEDVAGDMWISPGAVRQHVSRIKKKITDGKGNEETEET